MTVVVLRPTADVVHSATPVGGAAWAVLADDSDATYMTPTSPGHNAVVEMAAFALPTGAIIHHVMPRIRIARAVAGDGFAVVVHDSANAVLAEQSFVASSSFTTYSGPTMLGPWTELAANALRWGMFGLQGSGYVSAAYLDVVYVTQPVVTVTAPTGTVTNTPQPDVVWTATVDADGGPAMYYEAKIFTAAQYGAGGFDPSTSPATDETGVSPVVYPIVYDRHHPGTVIPWTPDPLVDGTYRAYVRVAQTVTGAQHWSAWDFEQFAISVVRPAVPTISLTAQSAQGRVLVTLAANAGSTTTDGFELQRLDGAEWVAVRSQEGDDGILPVASTTVYDYEAPNGTLTQYRARARHDYSGVFASSDWAVASTTWTSTQWWLKDVLQPALNVPIELVAYGDVTRAARQGILQPLGATVPVVVADTRASAAGSSVVQTRTNAERDALEVAAQRIVTLLLQGPAGAGEPDRYIRVGDLTVTRLVENINVPVRRMTLVWVETAAPTGAQTGAQYA